MDGISSASAVVSLTVQLISTARDVVNFLKEIQDSPKELHCTIEYLDQLQANFEAVKGLVEEQISFVDAPKSILNIGNALKICEERIKKVEIFVNKVRGTLDGRSPVRKKWAAFKHVLKKEEIRKHHSQLDSAARVLQIAIIINTNELSQYRTIQPRAAFVKSPDILNDRQLPVQNTLMARSNLTEENNLNQSMAAAKCAAVALMESDIALNPALRVRNTQGTITDFDANQENNVNCSSLTKFSNPLSKSKEQVVFSPKSLPRSRVISKQSIQFWSWGFWGNVSLQKKSKVIENGLNAHFAGKQVLSKEEIYVLRPTFMKKQLQLRSFNADGHISWTLSTDCVVDFKAPVFEMCRLGDIRGLQDALESGTASLHVVNPLGMGLLHYAARSFQKETCSWLLERGVSADRTNVLGNNALTSMGSRCKINQTSTVTQSMVEIARVLAQAQDDFSAFEISMWFQEYEGPPEGAEFILSREMAQYYIGAADDGDPLYPALASILRLYAKKPKPWEPIIRTLIQYGADLHAPVRRKQLYPGQSEYPYPFSRYGTPLDELFMDTLDPFEGQAAANGWLQILESEGHDIYAYLERESALHVRPMQLTHPSSRTIGYQSERKLVFDWGVHPTVSWDWWINPSSSAYQLCEEFRLMAITPPDGLLIQMSWEQVWPFRFPAWSELHQYRVDAKHRKRHRMLLEQANARATARVARKTARIRRRKGRQDVPGAWPT